MLAVTGLAAALALVTETAAPDAPITPPPAGVSTTPVVTVSSDPLAPRADAPGLPGKPGRIALTVIGSFGYDRLLSAEFLSGGLALTVGAYLPRGVELGARFSLRGGRTAGGLPFLDVATPAVVFSVAVHERVRLGVTLGGLGLILIQRATKDEVGKWLAIEAVPSLEVLLAGSARHGALVLQLRAGAVGLLTGDGLRAEARVQSGLGYRF